MLAFLTLNSAFSQENQAATSVSRASLVTPELLDARIAAAEESSLPEDTKNKLLTLLRSIQSNLQREASNSELAATFKGTNVTAPAQTQAIRRKIEQEKGSDPLADLDLSIEEPLGELERKLQDEQAALAAAKTRLEDYNRRLLDESSRPAPCRFVPGLHSVLCGMRDSCGRSNRPRARCARRQSAS